MQRYYVNNQYYRFGGPVLVYSVGERTASELDLSDGWIDELAKRTNGLSVLLEQRFYGGSIPGPLVGDGLSDSAMWRYLTVEQMMADVKQFVEQAGTIPELTHSTLRHGRALAPLSVVLVGGSFAGSLMAWTKHQYPNLEALVISSSAPLNIVDDFWEFDKMAAQRLPCAKTLSQVIRAIDEAIDRGNATHIAELQRRFGLENVDTAGFVSALTIQVRQQMAPAAQPLARWSCDSLECRMVVVSDVDVLVDVVVIRPDVPLLHPLYDSAQNPPRARSLHIRHEGRHMQG
ncbi:hypothetical protein H4R26_000444 [Coemansia thaxteri]|uniref:Uncharacterized protein n=1 Tax=Coemansia thaxteri TaxID=2663907 RepID=A0A9W8BHL4_9FUNG|nr:hypothetical protein H4R26_000444 [Coemansia thaxteri]